MSELRPEYFRRADESPDEAFYVQPRLVTHIDEGAVAAVTELYRELIPPGAAVLDLMSSWVSHLPPEVEYGRVVGLGMNEPELRANVQLTEWVRRNLNTDPRLPFADGAFDAAACCVSVQYLTRPVELFAEVARVLRPGAPFAVTFSNRCFPTKAVAAWQALDDGGHVALVARYFAESGGWGEVRAGRRPTPGDPLYAVVGLRS
jgi:SAM-dependent methyltransferase